jgi:hypothetical protein
MSEAGYVAVLVAAITASAALLGTIVTSVFSALTNRRSKRVEAKTEIVREQVQNDHGTNLREEQDHRHRENSTTLAEVSQKLSDVLERVEELADADTNHHRRLTTIEEATQPRSPWAPRARHVKEEPP